MELEEIRRACSELMATAEIAYLTTLGLDGYPHTRAIFNLRNREAFPKQAALHEPHTEDLVTYVATNTSSRKVREIEADPRVDLYYCAPSSFHGLRLVGDAEIVEDPAIKEGLWGGGWKQYNPSGRPDDPDYTVFRIRPHLASGWYASSRFEFPLGAG